MSSLANDAERRVVEAFRDGLTDGWLVFPDIGLRGERRDFQMDLVLVHEEWGVTVVEVKGHKIELRQGQWCDNRGPLEMQPLKQARTNAYELRDRLRSLHPSLANLNVEYGVAVPNTQSVVGHLPPETQREQIITATDLDDPADAVERLLTSRFGNHPLSRDAVAAIVDHLCPEADFAWNPDAIVVAARQRLDEICSRQVEALQSLDMNRRVFVRGRAGTGKTRLVTGWARQAFGRDERVLVTCYNDPLGAAMKAGLPDDPDMVVGSFWTVVRQLPGLPALVVPADADHAWWNGPAAEHLQEHWGSVTDRFDTIVIDEGQDFSAEWLSLLERLLDPATGGRMLMVGDVAQDLYGRGFAPPEADAGWTVAELQNNCRNAHRIASLLRRKLDGARSPMVGPEGAAVRWVPATSDAECATVVAAELTRLLDADGRDPSGILVATVSSALRDSLRAELGLSRWEDRTGVGVAGVGCENVHRVKGLEADTVVLVADAWPVEDALLYVGVSRAVAELVVVGPPALATRLGLAG